MICLLKYDWICICLAKNHVQKFQMLFCNAKHSFGIYVYLKLSPPTCVYWCYNWFILTTLSLFYPSLLLFSYILHSTSFIQKIHPLIIFFCQEFGFLALFFFFLPSCSKIFFFFANFDLFENPSSYSLMFDVVVGEAKET